MSVAAVSAPRAQADCLPRYEAEIQKRQQKIAHFRHVKWKVVEYTALGVGVPVGIAGGLLFVAITDGATIPVGILEGMLFGGIAGAAAGAAVYVPLETVELIKKARLLPFVHANELLTEARNHDREGKLLKHLLKQVRRHDSKVDLDDLIAILNEGNEHDAFCGGSKLLKLRAIKKYVTGVASRQGLN